MSFPQAGNPLAALRSFLELDAGVSALVGTRVFAAELPRDEVSSMPRKCLVISLSGGPQSIGARSDVPHSVDRYDMRCYGETPYQASLLFYTVRVIMRRLHRQVMSDGVSNILIHDAVQTGGPLTLREESGDWPLLFGSWEIFTGDEGWPPS